MSRHTNLELFSSFHPYSKTLIKKIKNSEDFFSTFFNKNINNLISYQNLKNASNKSTPINIPNLPYDIIYDLEETTEDNKPKLPEKILLNNIASIFFPNTTYIDNFGS